MVTMTYESTTYMVFRWLKDAEDPDMNRVVRNVGSRELFSRLLADFEYWCTRTHRVIPTQRSFGTALTVHGFPAIRGPQGVKMRGGLHLTYYGPPNPADR